MIKLIGILIIVIGFMWKKDTIAVVVVAGITTGLVSGIPFNKVVEILGTHRWILWNSFNSNGSQF